MKHTVGKEVGKKKEREAGLDNKMRSDMQKSVIYSSQHTYLFVVTKCLFLPWTPHETISQHYALDGSDPLTSFLASLNYSRNCVPWTVSKRKRGAPLFPASHLTGWCSLVNWFGKCWSRIYLSNLAI